MEVLEKLLGTKLVTLCQIWYELRFPFTPAQTYADERVKAMTCVSPSLGAVRAPRFRI